jgi:hypothetical protein
MPRPDDHFRAAARNISDGSAYEYVNRYFFPNSFDSNIRIGFTSSLEFCPENVQNNFWVKPDFYMTSEIYEGVRDTIVFEHCGTWQNLYQKRFIYQSNDLSLYRYCNGLWNHDAQLKITRVVYLLKYERHMRRVCRVCPTKDYERFIFNYECWRNEPHALDPIQILELAQTKEEVQIN